MTDALHQNTVNVGIIGTGVMGAEHARLLRHEVSGAAVAAVYDPDGGRAGAVAAATGARSLDDPYGVIADADVAAVLIASDDASHADFVLAGIEAGKPVLCEKPLAPDVADCQRIIAAEVTGRRQLVTVGFMRRFDPGYQAMRAGLTDGALGAALLLHCVHRNQTAPAGLPSSALITGSAVHEFDISRWLLGDELASITAHRGRSAVQAGRTRDPLLLVASTVSGTLIDIEVFVNAGYGYEVRCELVGEQGTLALDAPAPTVRRAANQVGRSLPTDWRPRFAEAYRRELQAWIDGLMDGQLDPNLASGWDGYCATVLAQAGVTALETSGPVEITLMDKPELYR